MQPTSLPVPFPTPPPALPKPPLTTQSKHLAIGALISASFPALGSMLVALTDLPFAPSLTIAMTCAVVGATLGGYHAGLRLGTSRRDGAWAGLAAFTFGFILGIILMVWGSVAMMSAEPMFILALQVPMMGLTLPASAIAGSIGASRRVQALRTSAPS